MQRIAQTPIFRVGTRDFLGVDVLIFAIIGELFNEFVSALRAGLELERQNADNQQISKDQIEEELVSFRYDNDLIASEDVQVWLARHAIKLEELHSFLTREILRRRHPDASFNSNAPIDPRVIEVALVEGLCSGAFKKFANSLASVLAVTRLHGYNEPVDAQPLALIQNVRETLQTYGITVPPDLEERVNLVVAAGGAYKRHIEGELDEQALFGAIKAHPIDWTSVRYQAIYSNDVEVLDKLLLAAREGSEVLEQLADKLTLAHELREELLCEISEVMGDLISRSIYAAKEGELMGPYPTNNDEFVLLQLYEKRAPSVQNEQMRDLAAEYIVRSVREQALSKMVRWYDDPLG